MVKSSYFHSVTGLSWIVEPHENPLLLHRLYKTTGYWQGIFISNLGKYACCKVWQDSGDWLWWKINNAAIPGIIWKLHWNTYAKFHHNYFYLSVSSTDWGIQWLLCVLSFSICLNEKEKNFLPIKKTNLCLGLHRRGEYIISPFPSPFY